MVESVLWLAFRFSRLTPNLLGALRGARSAHGARSGSMSLWSRLRPAPSCTTPTHGIAIVGFLVSRVVGLVYFLAVRIKSVLGHLLSGTDFLLTCWVTRRDLELASGGSGPRAGVGVLLGRTPPGSGLLDWHVARHKCLQKSLGTVSFCPEVTGGGGYIAR